MAVPIEYVNPPTAFTQAILDQSKDFIKLFWYRLAPETRRGYNTTIKSFDFFCKTQSITPWPASLQALEEWTTIKFCGSTTEYLRQVKPDTVSNYLSALRSYHVDCNLHIDAFDNPHLKRIIKGGKRLYPSIQKKRRLITHNILEKIANFAVNHTGPNFLDELNLDVVFKVAWAGFLRMREFTFYLSELKKRSFQIS